MSEVFSHKTLREQVAVILRKRILSGAIGPGEKIKEVEISKEFNISRGPVREALRQIEQEGLIVYSANKGCTVKTLSPSSISEVYLIRSTVEALAVRVYSGNMKQSTIEKLEMIVDDIGVAAEKNDLNSIVENVEKFHATIVREAGLDKLFNIWKSFAGVNAATYYTMQKAGLMPNKRLKLNHMNIVNAFKDGKTDNICEVIQKHYMVVPEDLFKQTKSKEECKTENRA